MNEKEWAEWVNWRKTVDAAIERLHGGQDRLSDRLELNTKLTLETKQSVETLTTSLGALPAFMNEGQHTFKFVKRLATLAKWLMVLFVLPALVIYALFYGLGHNGHAPEWTRMLWKLIMEFNA